jgi:hypothetical protein
MKLIPTVITNPYLNLRFILLFSAQLNTLIRDRTINGKIAIA